MWLRAGAFGADDAGASARAARSGASSARRHRFPRLGGIAIASSLVSVVVGGYALLPRLLAFLHAATATLGLGALCLIEAEPLLGLVVLVQTLGFVGLILTLMFRGEARPSAPEYRTPLESIGQPAQVPACRRAPPKKRPFGSAPVEVLAQLAHR